MKSEPTMTLISFYNAHMHKSSLVAAADAQRWVVLCTQDILRSPRPPNPPQDQLLVSSAVFFI